MGVSPDSIKSHDKFAAKQQLPFTLLADEGHQLAEAYGVWGEKSFMGKKYMGIDRSTFIIDKHGVLRRVYNKVKVKGHAEEVLAFVRTL